MNLLPPLFSRSRAASNLDSWPMANFEKVFNDMFQNWPSVMNGDSDQTFQIDVKESDDSYTVVATLADIKKEEIDVSMENNVLTVQTKKESEEQEEKEKYVLRERLTSQASRSIYLPHSDENKINAQMKGDTLTVTIAKIPEKQIKSIEIK